MTKYYKLKKEEENSLRKKDERNDETNKVIENQEIQRNLDDLSSVDERNDETNKVIENKIHSVQPYNTYNI